MWKKILALAGINWYVVLAGLLLLAGAWAHGYHKASVNCAENKAEEVAKQAKAEKKETEKRVPQVITREVESEKQRAEINRLREKLDDALRNKPDNPACAISDAERNAFNELSEQTRR